MQCYMTCEIIIVVVLFDLQIGGTMEKNFSYLSVVKIQLYFLIFFHPPFPKLLLPPLQ